MLAGRRLLESLIVYCKIDVAESIRSIKTRRVRGKGVEELKEGEGDDDMGDKEEKKFYDIYKADDLEQELT